MALAAAGYIHICTSVQRGREGEEEEDKSSQGSIGQRGQPSAPRDGHELASIPDTEPGMFAVNENPRRPPPPGEEEEEEEAEEKEGASSTPG